MLLRTTQVFSADQFLRQICRYFLCTLGDVPHGVWYPEEAFQDSTARSKLLAEATQGAFLWDRQLQ
jgi:hypothetical protein